MLGSSCNPCCAGCVVPPFPDSIEIDITRNSSAYGSVVFGTNYTSGQTYYSSGALMYPPDGLFSLSPVAVTATTAEYTYTNSELSLRVFMQNPVGQIQQGIGLTIQANVVRVKTVPGSTAPTQAELSNANWDSGCGGTFALTHTPPLALGGVMYQYDLLECPQIGMFPITQTVNRGCLADVYSQTVLALNQTGAGSGRGCYAAGCAFPAEYQYAAVPSFSGVSVASLSPPRQGGSFSFVLTDDLNIHRNGQPLYKFSESGIFVFNTAGYVSSTVNSVKFVYGTNREDVFPAVGNSACSSLAQGSPSFSSQPPCP